MGLRYLVVDSAFDQTPVLTIENNDINIAIENFKVIAKRALVASVILYDSTDDKVCRVFMNSEPIFLVKAIEFARDYANQQTDPPEGSTFSKSELINLIADKLSNPGKGIDLDNYDTEYIIAPYHNLDGGSAPKAEIVGSVMGGMWGATEGFFRAGPVGAVLGGILGVYGGGAGASHVINKITRPSLCKDCKGVGLEDNNYRCSKCYGYGYPR